MKKNKCEYIAEYLGNLEILRPSCNMSTIEDGRGGIFTWMFDEKIVELNLIYYQPNKVRGNHYHPEFNEYWMLIDGNGVKVTQDPNTKKKIVRHVGSGTMVRVPKNTTHSFHAITESKAISLLTKYWDHCKKPIVHEELIDIGQDYKNYAKQKGFRYSAEELIRKNNK